MALLNKEMKQLKLRINGQEVYISDLENDQENLKKQKEEKIKELIWNYRTLNTKLETELD